MYFLAQMNDSLQQQELEYLDEAFSLAVQCIGTVYSVKSGLFGANLLELDKIVSCRKYNEKRYIRIYFGY
jgi:hypothetical protein